MPEPGASFPSLLLLGFFLGMRHATDADHVIAIATIVSRQRNLMGSAKIGMAWGVGHTITVAAVGSAIILFGLVIPARVGLAMEFAVGVMLLTLGVLTLTGAGRALQPAAFAHAHSHSGAAFAPESRERGTNEAPGGWFGGEAFGGLLLFQWFRPFVIGLVHGLAGSAAVALLVLTIVRDAAWAMAYLLVFGLGTIGGMMLITLLLSAPFALTSASMPRLNWRLRVASGLLSFVFGLFLIYSIGFSDGGLFTDSPSWTPS